MASFADQVFQIITEKEPITTKEILDVLKKYSGAISKEQINSVLYGELRESIIRDVNEKGIPTWRIRKKTFSAAGGLEAKLYEELIRKKIITKENSSPGYGVKDKKSGKTYHLDIAVFVGDNKYDIEVDGFDHVRADALASIERQIIEGGKNAEIEIDWMDNEKSYIAYNEIDTKSVYTWLGEHIDWCIRYHEELLWPKDITRNIRLIEKGWKVIRFWNGEVRDHLPRVVKDIRDFLS